MGWKGLHGSSKVPHAWSHVEGVHNTSTPHMAQYNGREWDTMTWKPSLCQTSFQAWDIILCKVMLKQISEMVTEFDLNLKYVGLEPFGDNDELGWMWRSLRNLRPCSLLVWRTIGKYCQLLEGLSPVSPSWALLWLSCLVCTKLVISDDKVFFQTSQGSLNVQWEMHHCNEFA